MKNPIRESYFANVLGIPWGGGGFARELFAWLDSFDGCEITYPEPEPVSDPEGNRAKVRQCYDGDFFVSSNQWRGPCCSTTREAVEAWNKVMGTVK